jgi:murein DD-endopeptidase MepM/ murein hydrolase activator NlpD
LEVEERTVSGTRGRCWDYAFPAGDPVCGLPVPDAGLVTGGQQFNSVSGAVTHQGLDFAFASPLPAIVAPCDGVVVELNRHAISLGNLIVDVVIKYNDAWTTFIAFEPYSPDPALADAQEAEIDVTINQVVRQGDVIGRLVVPATAYPHVHWGVTRNDAERTPVCPRDYTTPAARAALDALYARLGLAPACLPPP